MIRPFLTRSSSNLKQLRTNESGVAITEFAFSLPIMLSLLLGGLEVANLAMANLRVSQIAMTVADNAGRVQTGLDEANIYEVFEGARLVGEPIDFMDNGRIVLSSLESNGLTDDDAGQWVRWQRCTGNLDLDSRYAEEDDGRTDDSLADGLGPTGNKIVSDDDTAVMFVEVTYEYQSLAGLNFIGPRTIRYESAFNVRGRTNQAISNTQGLAVNSC